MKLEEVLEKLKNALEDMDADQQVMAITDLREQLGVTEDQVRLARESLKSLPSGKWAGVAPQLGFLANLDALELKHFAPPVCLLPPSMHKAMFKEGWRMMDVYRERTEQNREAARVKLLEPWLVPVIGLFEGRVIDLPETPMVVSEYSSGGIVEHKVVVVGNAMFLVIELKLRVELQDNLAQLFLELLSAAKANKMNNYPGLRVYVLLTDLTLFYSYSYDPVQGTFFEDDRLVANIRRDQFCFDMIDVANKLFSVLMNGYIHSLEATVSLNEAKSEGQDLPDNGAWKCGLALAKEAQEKLSQCISTGSIEALEGAATSALGILTQRHIVHYFCPPVGPASLEDLTDGALRIWYKQHLQIAAATGYT